MSLPHDVREELEAARILAERRQWGAAGDAYRGLLMQIHHPDTLYDDWVRAMADVSLRGGRTAVAAVCLEYLLDHDRAYQAYQRARRFHGAARCRMRAGDQRGAAEAYESIGSFARAGVAWEQANEPGRASEAWDRAAGRYASADDSYRHSLALVNVGLAQLDAKDRRGRSTLSRAMVILEEEADRAETRDDVNRAVSCYHALIHIGRKTSTHENLAEGFLNCIRLMSRQDHRFFVLQYFHDFAEASLELGEPQAAAEVQRDAAEYCRRTGMLYGDHFLYRSAEAFVAAAQAHLEGGAAAELAENALLAALDCHNRRSDVLNVQTTYQRLAALPLPDSRRERYETLAEGPKSLLGGGVGGWPFRGYFKDDTAYPPVWRNDLTREDGDPDLLAPVREAVGDGALWDVVRRRCLLICLRQEDEDAEAGDPEFLRELVSSLGRLGAPLAVVPLARIYDDAPVSVRALVATNLRFLPFRDSVELCGRIFSDPEGDVFEAALAALRYLVFPGAFAPLIRLYREHPDVEIRREVVLALGRLVGMDNATSRDALDFLLHTLREGVDPMLVEDLQTAISVNSQARSLDTLERHLLAEPDGPAREFIERVTVRIETRTLSDRLHVG